MNAQRTTTTWNTGDNTTTTCNGPGNPYQPGTQPQCTHTYNNPGTYNLQLTTTWQATWTSNTGQTGTQTNITLTATTPITIKTAQATTN